MGERMNNRAYRAHWPQDIQDDIVHNEYNGMVGSVLVSETENLRVWHLHIPAGERCAFHRHVLDYFWTCHSHGESRSYFEDGSIKDAKYQPGSTRHFSFRKGEYLLHSVENIGQETLLFTTVEFKRSANPPLPVSDSIRLTEGVAS